MKTSIFISICGIMLIGGYATLRKEKHEDKIDYTAVLEAQKEINKKAAVALRNNILSIRNSGSPVSENERDTIIQERIVVKEKYVRDTILIEVPKYKTITRTIFVGKDYNQKNNLKVDTNENKIP